MALVSVDYIHNGIGAGDVAGKILEARGDMGIFRPFFDPKTRQSYVTVNEGGKQVTRPVHNVTASLLREEWIEIDRVVLGAAKHPLKAAADLRSAGLTYTLNGMGKTMLYYNTRTGSGNATMSMDGLREAERDRPDYGENAIPLPITHGDFSFSAREIATSRNEGTPLDLSQAEETARAIAEMVEMTTLGLNDGFRYAGHNVYGYLNFPSRMTKVITSPLADGWVPQTLLTELIAAKKQMYDAKQPGPYRIYVSPNWELVLDNDWSAAKGDITLRERIKRIEGLADIQTLHHLPGFTILIVAMRAGTVRLVIGMDLTTVQWPEKGGMATHFKTMCIMVPQIRADAEDNCGVLHAAPAG